MEAMLSLVFITFLSLRWQRRRRLLSARAGKDGFSSVFLCAGDKQVGRVDILLPPLPPQVDTSCDSGQSRTEQAARTEQDRAGGADGSCPGCEDW
mmetsp:Transcript_5304/g.17142  ORF Transcript_5304/g.17142 Transcript_5304/m.17142 type:complete len:95 (+) Transcript_5304:423-707(+)